jgi:hypothetical protein
MIINALGIKRSYMSLPFRLNHMDFLRRDVSQLVYERHTVNLNFIVKCVT